MMRMDYVLRALLLLTTSVGTQAFNIDTQKKWGYAMKKTLFGQKVIQHNDGAQNWILVTSPAKDIQSRLFGGLYRCEVIPKQIACKCERFDHTSVTELNLRQGRAWPGASLTRNSDTFLACVQHKSTPFRSVTGELNGQCSLFTAGLPSRNLFNLSKIVEEGLANRNMNNNNGNGDTDGSGVEEDLAKINLNNSDSNGGTAGSRVDDRLANKNINNRSSNGDDDGSRAELFKYSRIVQKRGAEGNYNNNNNAEGGEDDDESRTEVAIVLDGSGSIDPPDFQRAKDFIYDMMTTFWKKCLECEFAVVQYGKDIRTEFNLLESRDSQAALRKVQEIQQVYSVTKTASAIKHVLDSIFHEDNGSKKNAKKIIVVLTDGEILLDEMNLTTVINLPQMRDIERYAIGVGEAFSKSKALEELQLIASDPDDKHLFRITNYSALEGLLSTLEQKLVGIEGTAGDVLQFELAELGFSTQILSQQSLLLGAVGAFDWSGGLVRYNMEKVEDEDDMAFLNESLGGAQSVKYSYLGYSLALVQGKPSTKEPLYISGAPRHSNTGKVLVFEKDIHSYRIIHRLHGDQVGSYFGSELCPLDVDMDNLTDYLLVGAPFYHIKGEEGRVYIYKFDQQDRFTLVKSLNGQPGYSFARFGFAMATIGDINRDGYSDIAIGAPVEEDFDGRGSSGSVYIYNGCRNGITEPWSQRVRAADVSVGLKYFGQSIDGGLDFTNDGYVDIAVGALGEMLVLRSRPVIRLNVTVDFTPDEVPIMSDQKPMEARLCFGIESTFQKLDTQKSRVIYTVDLDIGMEPKRIMFEGTKQHIHTGEIHIDIKCATHKLIVLPCKYDCFTSINISISYSLKVDQMRDHPAPILDKYGILQRYIELPYMKDCNEKPICVADLKLFIRFSEKELVVGDTKDLTTHLSLRNDADNSYLTTMLLTYPRNLQVKKIVELSSPSAQCSEAAPFTSSLSSMTCKIGYPVFRKSSVQFTIMWQLDEAIFPGSVATFAVNVTSINEGAEPLTQEHILPVKHSFTAVLSRPRAVIEVNISQALTKNKEVQYEFNVNGENKYGVLVELTIWIPVTMKGIKVSALKEVQSDQNTTQCNITDEMTANSDEDSNLSPCATGTCQVVKCAIVTSKEDIIVFADLDLEALQQVVEEKTELVVSAGISYNTSLYADLKPSNKKDAITVMLLKDRTFLTLPLIIGSSAGGLLLLALIIIIMWKCGFFKRSYKDRRE